MSTDLQVAAGVIGCTLRRNDEFRSRNYEEWEAYADGLQQKGEKQIQCSKCMLWMFDSERCGLFETL